MENSAPYHLLTSIVAPRPIAWVSTISAAGVSNLAPFSFFNAVAGFPLTIMFSVSYRCRESREKDTLRNVKEINEFVCHVLDETMAQAMVKTTVEFPYDRDEFEDANLKAVASVNVCPMRIADVPVAMECKVTQIIPVEGSSSVMVLGQVLRFHVHPELYRPDLGLVDTILMKPITCLGSIRKPELRVPQYKHKLGGAFPSHSPTSSANESISVEIDSSMHGFAPRPIA